MKKTIRFLKNHFHLVTAIIAAFRYGFPGKKLFVIGITGTDGKTTTSSLVAHILRHAGKKVSLISTVSAQIANEKYDTGFHVSTPGAFSVQRFLKESLANNDDYFVLETTSHALDQYRVWGVLFQIGLITNISHEHLDYHENFENYVAAKATLLRQSKVAIVNIEDESYRALQKYLPEQVISFGLNSGDIHTDVASKLQRKLAGFNKYNFLAAYAVVHRLGLTDEEIFAAMETFVLPPGRMEVIQEKPFTAIVDFAHTPKAIAASLDAVRELYLGKNGKVIHVFGSAAKRDLTKRPLMGLESAKRADIVILTEEDYRDEDPIEIAKQIAVGLEKTGFQMEQPHDLGRGPQRYTIVTNRQKALKLAAAIAKPGDIVIATGKGHEQSLCRGKTEVPWDEKTEFEKVLRERVQ